MPHPTVNPFLSFEPGQAERAAGDFECLLIEVRLGAITSTLMGSPRGRWEEIAMFMAKCDC